MPSRRHAAIAAPLLAAAAVLSGVGLWLDDFLVLAAAFLAAAAAAGWLTEPSREPPETGG